MPQHPGNPDPRGYQRMVDSWLAMTPEDAGAVRATFRPRPPWWAMSPWLALGVGLSLMALVVNPPFFVVSGPLILGVFGLIALAAWIWHRGFVTRVASHALVLGRRKVVVPYASIDPARVAISTRVRNLPRHVHSAGTVILQSQGSTAVVNGFRPGQPRVATYAPPGSSPSPYAEWGLSGEPAAVLQALEQAMAADGHPAHGMAEWARRHTFTPTWDHPEQDLLVQRRAYDPPLGHPHPERWLMTPPAGTGRP